MHFRALLCLVLLGCSSSSAGSADGADAPHATSGAAPVPVSGAPLQGTVGGKPFAGKAALATYGAKSGAAEILVFDTPETCAHFGKLPDGWRVQVAVRWRAGVTGDVGDLAQLDGAPVGTSSDDLVGAWFVSTKSGATHTSASHEGRVEVIEAGTTEGSRGRLRVRATSEEGHLIEGEMPVELCAIYTDR